MNFVYGLLALLGVVFAPVPEPIFAQQETVCYTEQMIRDTAAERKWAPVHQFREGRLGLLRAAIKSITGGDEVLDEDTEAAYIVQTPNGYGIFVEFAKGCATSEFKVPNPLVDEVLRRVEAAEKGSGATAPQAPAMTVWYSFGGRLDEFVEKYYEWRQAGVRVRVEGFCISACTFILGIIPRDRVCVSDQAIFGFHSAWSPGPDGRPKYSAEGTNLIWNLYPKFVRDILTKLGWDGGEHPSVLYVKGTEFYPLCTP